MAQVLPVIDVGGIKKCGQQTHAAGLSCLVGDTENFYLYQTNESIRRPGHQHWMLTGVGNADLSNAWHAGAVDDTQGVVYRLDWRTIETSFGVYALNHMINAAVYLAARGKKIIPRLYWKVYNDTNDPPLAPNVPAYMQADPTTYGGSASRGGLYKGIVNGRWSARLEHPAVNARFLALLDEIAASFAANPTAASALQGIMLDESTWSVGYEGTHVLPDSLTAAVQIQTMKDIYSYMKTKFAGYEIYPNVNYTQGDEQSARDLQQWCIDQNLNVGITDTFRPSDMWGGRQPVYKLMPRNRKTLVHVDYMSMGADDAGLKTRMIENALTTAYLGADITAWYLQGGSSGPHWAMIKNAMQIIG